MTTPLQKAENAVTDTHLRLSALAERRASLTEQTGAAEALEARLLRGGSDLAALAEARNRVSAGRDLIAATGGEIDQIAAQLTGLEAELAHETALAALSGHADAGKAPAGKVAARIARITQFLAVELPLLEAEHDELSVHRAAYDAVGVTLHPAWASEQRPRERDQLEGLLRRRGVSLKAVAPEGLQPPSGADGPLAAAWGLYRTIRQQAWVRAELAKAEARREAEQERQRQREERERGFEIVRIAFPRANEVILEALPGHLTDRRSHRGPDREMVLTVELERRHLSETLAALKRDLSPDNYGLIAVDDDGARPVPTPLAPASDVQKRRVVTRPDPRALTRP